MPAVIIRRESEHAVAHLGFASEFGFWNRCHTNDSWTKGFSVVARLGAGGKRRAFHAHIRATEVNAVGNTFCGLLDPLTHIEIKRIGEFKVTNDAFTKKGLGPFAFGSIEDLIRNDHITGTNMLLHNPNCTHRQYMRDAKGFQSVDIRPIVDFGRRKTMAFAMTRKKINSTAVQLTLDNLIAGLSERRFDRVLGNEFHARHLINARATDNTEFDRKRDGHDYYFLWLNLLRRSSIVNFCAGFCGAD